MKIALVKNNKIENIIEADLEFAQSLGYTEVFEATTEGIGFEKIGGVWLSQEVIKLANRTPTEILEEKTTEETQWRDSELERTDKLATIKDHPYFYAHISYRVLLRDYPTSLDFPNGIRPTLDTTIKNALTKFQFMSRFTVVERKAITALAKTNQDLADWLDLFKLTEEMNLNDPQTIAGVQMLEAGGIIGVGRANEILA